MERELLMQELRGMVENGSSSSFVLRRRVEQLHEIVFGRPFIRTSCRNCYHDAIILMYNHLKKGNPIMEEREFILKRGIVIQPEFGKGKFYTALTITDDVAREYLKKHPEGKKYFEKIGKMDSEVKEVEKPEEMPQVQEEKVEKKVENIAAPAEENKVTSQKKARRGNNRKK